LREISNFILYLELFHTLKSDQFAPDKWYHLSIFIIFILYFKPELREKIRKKDILASELCKFLGINSHIKAKELTHDKDGVSRDIATLIMIFLNDNSIPGYQSDDEEDFKGWLSKLALSTNVGYLELITYIEQFINDIFNEFQFVTK
ncbi:TPA: hypothetical protein JBH21_14510, partial [Legionella pneumophila]|nr:hypothetical protein [Legionella pneumophila]